MLERDSLFVGTWVRASGGSSLKSAASVADWGSPNKPANGAANKHLAGGLLLQTQPILDPVTLVPLGKVRGTEPASSLLRWFVRPKWEVVETEDESLLMTVVCPRWIGRTWDVFDAEDNLVCTLTKGEIYDSWGHLRANLIPSTSKELVVVRSRDRREVGQFSPKSHGVLVRFAEAIAEDPYAKMAVLAAALPHQKFFACR